MDSLERNWFDVREKVSRSTLKIIVIGLPRTGTISLKAALEYLGYGPCHHLLLPACQVTRLRQSARILQVQPGYARQDALRKFFSGYELFLDMPGSACVDDLVSAFPNAKVILTLRSCPYLWFQSYQSIIRPLTTLWFLILTYWLPGAYWGWLMTCRWQDSFQSHFPGLQVPSPEMYEAHRDFVRAVTPLPKLLEFEPSEGWAPLCGFLGVPMPVPDVPFPRRNERSQLLRRHYLVCFLGVVSWLLVFWMGFAVTDIPLRRSGVR